MHQQHTQWKPGDVVALKSGGPAMTVAVTKDRNVLCHWFDNSNTAHKGYFVPEELEAVDG